MAAHVAIRPSMLVTVKLITPCAIQIFYCMFVCRDNPDNLPAFLVSNNCKESCVLKVEGDNIFGTVGYVIFTVYMLYMVKCNIPVHGSVEVPHYNTTG